MRFSLRWVRDTPQGRDALLSEAEVLAVQLHALDTAELIDFEPIGELYLRSAAQLRVLRGAAKVAEGDRLDWFAVRTIAHSELHFKMLATDDPRAHDPKIPVDAGSRKPW